VYSGVLMVSQLSPHSLVPAIVCLYLYLPRETYGMLPYVLGMMAFPSPIGRDTP
jgi:hypothetical protein